MPQAIVAVKPASSASGASGVTRYIAESKRDQVKEELKEGEARPLFSTQLDDLDYHQANDIIGQSFDEKAQADQVIHLVISLEPDQFEALGDDLQERKDAFKEIVREAAEVIHKEVGTRDLDWVAGIHLNTDNPHAHIAISREGVEADSARFKRIDHLPRTLLPHREEVEGQKVLKDGLIAEAVTLHLNLAIDRHRESQLLHSPEPEHQTPQIVSHQDQPTRSATPIISELQDDFQSPDREDVNSAEPSSSPAPRYVSQEEKDRELLGRAMIAAAQVEKLDKELNSLIEHGDKRRFRVYDASHGRTRQISQFDVHRRAEARAGATVRQLEIVDPDQRHELRTERYKNEVASHGKALHDHNVILVKTITKTNKELTAATNEHNLLQGQVRAIVRDYSREHRSLPTPLLSRAELSSLQNVAISNGNPTRVKTLENIRESLAVEHDSQTRTDQEIARLEGQLLVARVEQAARATRVKQFEETKHQTSWQIGKQKFSLAFVDRQIGEKENASSFFRSPMNLMTLFFPGARRAAAAAAAQLKDVRVTILEKIADRQRELGKSLNEAAKMTETLSSIFTAERDKQQARNGERLEKELTRNELSRLVDHSLALGDPAMLRQALLLESRYNQRQEPTSNDLVEQAARSAGRAVITKIAVKESRTRLDQFTERRDFVPVLVKDLSGQELTLRLADLREPYHPLKLAIHRLTEGKESRHLRNELHRTLDQTEAQLKQEAVNFKECNDIVRNDTLSRQADVLLSNQPIPDATFTTRQISQLEMYAVRQQDSNERDRILQLIEHAELAHHVFTPVKLDQAKAEPANPPLVDADKSLDGHDRDPAAIHPDPGITRESPANVNQPTLVETRHDDDLVH